jgi:signal transduction histidine kinase
VRDLLRLRKKFAERAPDVGPVLEECTRTIIQEVVSDLEYQIDRNQGRVEFSHLPTIDADPTQMHQLIQNLINNALKFHQNGVFPLIQVSSKIKGSKMPDLCKR